MRNISYLPDTYAEWVRNRPYAAQMVEALYQLADMDDSTNSRKCLRPSQIDKSEKTVSSSSSVTYLIQHHADTTFFPNVRELLSILAVLPLGSCEAEMSFSCVRRIHSWLRSSMSTDRLSDLCVIAMHGNIPVSTEEIVNRFITLHPRRMQGQSLFSL
ncbi:repressor of the inhibitor of the protein kinase [Nymphon striatum]|nr:repressor of the inhibitor of the protein kinase [Nymphon striatum]